MINKLFNEDCMNTMARMKDDGVLVDAIITSPFYNTNTKQGKSTVLLGNEKDKHKAHIRYDKHVDNLTDDEYINLTLDWFDNFDNILAKDGVILYNLSYASSNTHLMNLVVADIIRHTNFTLADTIVWKKSHAMPNNVSPNKLTRIVEFVYVFVRKSEFKSFKSNKEVVSERANGQKMYNSPNNFIEAKNNDGSNPYNKATYSSELINKLIKMYVRDGSTVYDPFMGTGTTALSCVMNGLNYIGSEISENQVQYSEERILKYKEDNHA